MPVTSRVGLDNLRKTLENNLPTISTPVTLVCIASSPYICSQAKRVIKEVLDDWDGEVAGNSVIVGRGSVLTFAKDFLPPDDLVIVWNETQTFPFSMAQAFGNSFIEFPNAGLVASRGATLGIKYSNLYSDNSRQSPVIGEGLVEIDDLAEPTTFATRASSLLAFSEPDISYGLWLRRCGFSNYVNTSIKPKM